MINNNIIKLIIKAEKSTDRGVQQKLNSLKTMFIGENKLLAKASHFKSVTEAGCIAATAFILGGLLPWFNIQYTKKLYEKKNAENKDLSNDKPKTVSINI